MKHFSTLLKEQIKASGQFEKTTGTAIGSDFKEFIEDVLHSDTCATAITSTAMAVIESSPLGILASLSKYTGEPATLQNVVKENINVFLPALALLYWGIQIGRAEKAQEIKELEKLGLALSDDVQTATGAPAAEEPKLKKYHVHFTSKLYGGKPTFLTVFGTSEADIRNEVEYVSGIAVHNGAKVFPDQILKIEEVKDGNYIPEL